MDYDFKESSFLKIVSESILELKPNLKDKKLKLIFKKPKKELSKVLIDEDYTRQVIVNLIDNAIKYTNKDKGEIKIKLEEDGNIIRFSIKDEGAGISEETMLHLFQRYSREEKTYSKASRGMGLGLYIARRIVEDQHGKIWAESKGEGHGSTFFVELPVAGRYMYNKEKKDKLKTYPTLKYLCQNYFTNLFRTYIICIYSSRVG